MLFADLVILNTNIITMDKNNSRAEAVAVKNGRITEVGKTNEIKELIEKNTIIIDAHCHPISLVGR
jgi:predicted amidohydrolase YtcJ